jgi:penicillin G amidase
VGYAIAQDRLFQLELFRRATSGRLAEILGPDYLDDDLIARRDYYTDAEIDAMVKKGPAGLWARAQAYADGINAWVAKANSDPSKMPGEFPALGITPTNWTVRDSARVGVYLARTVPSGDGAELENARALRGMGPRAFNRLLPLRNKGRITTVPGTEGKFPSQPGRTSRDERRSYKNSQRFVAHLNLPSEDAAAATTRNATGGSYMWAISKRKRPRRHHKARPAQAYLFNGPQLGFSIPELFVEFEVHSPVQNVRGTSAAGIPLVGIGHNGHVAWGFTSGLSDEDDLYAEQLTGPESYRFKGRDMKMDCRNERFDFRTPATDLPDRLTDILGGKQQLSGSKTERICRTIHGPVQARSNGTAFARRYAIWGRELETIDGLTQLNDAQNVKQVNRAMLHVTWNENVIAADDQGNIGYWHPGLHPLRPRNFDERLPYPGTGEAEWRGLLRRSRTPHVINPRQGYLFNWNNMPSAGWTNGDTEARERATGPFHRSRWLRLLVRRARRKGTYEASRAVDDFLTTTVQQRAFVGRLLKRARKRASGRAAQVLDTLLAWHGNYTLTDSAGTVDPGVQTWVRFKQKAEQLALGHYGKARENLSGSNSTSHEYDIQNGASYALQNLSPSQLARAAGSAGDVLVKEFGTTDPRKWRAKRLMYKWSVQGAASPPDLPFFDRGTWEQSVELGP